MLALPLAGQEDVLRLHVPVQKPRLMGRLERLCELGEDPERALGREPALAAEGVRQREALDQAHGQKERPLRLPRLVHGQQVRVVERGGEPRLAEEALSEAPLARKLGTDQLHCHLALERELGRLVDDAHPSPAEQRLDPEAAEKGARS